MPKITKEAASDQVEAEGFAGRYEDLAGYTVGFETYTADADMAPLFVGLPDDRCQCPHMGYVFKGKLVYHYADGDDVIEGGEAYAATARPHPGDLRRDRADRIQPHRSAGENNGGRDEEHGGRRLTSDDGFARTLALRAARKEGRDQARGR